MEEQKSAWRTPTPNKSSQNGVSQQYTEYRKSFDPAQRSLYETNSRKVNNLGDAEPRKQYDTGQKKPPDLQKPR